MIIGIIKAHPTEHRMPRRSAPGLNPPHRRSSPRRPASPSNTGRSSAGQPPVARGEGPSRVTYYGAKRTPWNGAPTTHNQEAPRHDGATAPPRPRYDDGRRSRHGAGRTPQAGTAAQAASGSRFECRRRRRTARPWQPAHGRWPGRRRAGLRTAATAPRSAGRFRLWSQGSGAAGQQIGSNRYP